MRVSSSNTTRRVVGQWGGAGGAVCEDHFQLCLVGGISEASALVASGFLFANVMKQPLCVASYPERVVRDVSFRNPNARLRVELASSTSSWRQRPVGHLNAAQTAVQARVDGFIPSDARFGKQRCRWRRVGQVDLDVGETRKSSGRAAPHAIDATRRARAVRWQHASPRQPFLCKI